MKTFRSPVFLAVGLFALLGPAPDVAFGQFDFQEALLSGIGLAGPSEVAGGTSTKVALSYTVDVVHFLNTSTTVSVDNGLASPLVPVIAQGPNFLGDPVLVEIPTLSVRQRETVVVTASDDGVELHVSFTVLPPTIVAFELLPSSVEGDGQVEGRVRLSGKASPAGAVVNLSSADPNAVLMPGAVALAPNDTQVSFPIFARSAASARSVQLTASFAGSTKSATLRITPPTLAHVELDQNLVDGGESVEGSVFLSSSAPAGGILVSLQSLDPALAAVPATTTVPDGSDEGRFTVTTRPVTASKTGTIRASLQGVSLTDAITVRAAELSTLTLLPVGWIGGRTGAGRVDLSGPAPATGARVQLVSSKPEAVEVPPEVIVRAGARSARFDIATTRTLENEEVDVAATLGSATASATLFVLSGRKGDWDGDGDSDMADFARLQSCFAGPKGQGRPTPSPECRGAFDYDDDQDIDHPDYLAFEAGLEGIVGAPRVHVELDPGIRPIVTEIPGWMPGAPRPVAALLDEAGRQSELVANEIVIVSDDAAAVSGVASRWSGVEVETYRPRDSGIAMPTWHVLRVDSNEADPGSLEDDLATLNPDVTGSLRVSDDRARRLLAIAAREAAGGLTVAVNWVPRSSGLRDGSTLEASSAPGVSGYTPDSFQWGFLTRHDVPRAWRALDLAGRLGNKVKIAILDGGFAADADWMSGGARLTTLPLVSPWGATNPAGCPKQPCPWHGTNVTSTAMAQVGNGFGAAGVAGPVAAAPITVQTLGDMVTSILSISLALGAGARIINMSFEVPVPATLSWSVIPFNIATKLASATDHLLFAAAGNNGENVDDEDCFIVCWESTWHTPCENDGVICVGGTNSDGKTRASNSNYGAEEVDIYAPFAVWVGPDPSTGQTHMASGTSFSSPYAAGVAALIWAANPNLGADQVEDILYQTAKPGEGDVNRVVSAYRAVIGAMGSQPPSVRILSPENGKHYPESFWGSDIVFTALASDPEDGNVDVVWSSNIQGELSRGGGFSRRDLVPGTHVIQARVTDSDGVSSSDSVTIIVHRVAPDVWLIRPFEGAQYFAGEQIFLQAESFDRTGTGFRLPDASVQWLSDGTTSLGRGHVLGIQLPQGSHAMTVRGTDAAGSSAEAHATILVNPARPDPPPSVAITKPSSSFQAFSNRELFGTCSLDVAFEGQATDNNTHSPISINDMVWTTDRTDLQDALIGRGKSFTGNLVMETCNTTTIHHITLTVTDSRGTVASTAPTAVVILAPPR